MDTIEDERLMQWVENPLITASELIHQKARAERAGKSYAYIGMEQRQVDQRTLLGGFCRFNGTEEQNKAIARFKTLYEQAQLGGAKAMDPSKEPVDGGGINPESVLEIGADARRDLIRVQLLLGPVDYRRVEYVAILERGPTPYAKWRGFGADGRACSKAKVEVRRIADTLAVHWGYAR